MDKILIQGFRHLVPSPSDFPLEALEDKVLACCHRLVAQMTPLFRLGFRLGMWFFDHLCFLFGLGFKKFTNLSFDDQKRYLDRWENGPVITQEFFKSFRGVILMAFYSDARVWSYIGYDPRPHLDERIALKQKLDLEPHS